MKDKKLSFKIVLALLACAIILTSTFSYIVFSNPSVSFTTVLQEGSMVSTASYIIFKDGSTYYSRNGLTGAISYSGTNVSEVTKNSIDALPTSAPVGGLIHFRSGEYTFDSTITIDKSNVNLEGEGSDNTKLMLKAGANCHLISIIPATIKNFISIRDLTLWGNKANQSGQSHGIYVYGYAGDLKFQNLYVDNFLNKGIYALPTPTGRIWNLWIQSCLIEGNDEGGIFLNASVGTHFVHIISNYIHQNLGGGIRVFGSHCRSVNIIENEIKRNGQHGILLEGARYINIVGNQIFENSEQTPYTYDGVYLGKTGSNETLYVNINDNFINNQGFTGYQRYGINIEDLSDHLQVKGNQLEGNNNASINIAAGAAASSEIHGNLGFTTEFFGSATISAATYVDVTHNLAGTPDSVTVVPQSDINCTFWISNAGSTTFRINIQDSQTVTFYFYAQYKP